jgi:sugar lactone lactonase YvrE
VRAAGLAACLALAGGRAVAQVHKIDPNFPAKPVVFADGFGGCEGIAFNGEGGMFVSGANALWRIEPDGAKTKLADLYSNLGVTAYGPRDLLVADFGPTNAFKQDRNNDGIVWRITPEGQKTALVTGIGDPNFILMLKDGQMLISDDATNEIFVADSAGTVKLFSTAVNHPNGLVLSPDEKTLYVAQIFASIRPVVPDNQVWVLPLADGKPVRGARLLVRTGPGGANDGLAMDRLGRLYIAANNEGKVWRYDPATEEMLVICEGVYGVASLAFGEGEFDHKAIYLTTTYAAGRGGKVFKVEVGIEGAPLHH